MFYFWYFSIHFATDFQANPLTLAAKSNKRLVNQKLFDNYICADFKDDFDNKHNEVIVTGWGKKRKCKFCEKLDPTTKAFSDVLLRVKLPITNSIPGCGAYKSDSTQICAGGIEGPISK